MLCDKCGKNNATTHIKQIINGVVTERDLCPSCAAKEGFGKLSHGGLAEMLSSMFGDSLIGKQESQVTRCGCCGSSFADIAESGKCGCPECYNTFNSELLPYLKRVHGSIQHIGKIPNRAPLTVAVDTETAEGLRSKLNQLIREEKYEEAAIIRDKIKRLEGESK